MSIETTMIYLMLFSLAVVCVASVIKMVYVWKDNAGYRIEAVALVLICVAVLVAMGLGICQQ